MIKLLHYEILKFNHETLRPQAVSKAIKILSKTKIQRNRPRQKLDEVKNQPRHLLPGTVLSIYL